MILLGAMQRAGKCLPESTGLMLLEQCSLLTHADLVDAMQGGNRHCLPELTELDAA